MSNSLVNGNLGPKVEFDSAVLQHIRRHARGSMGAEICGVLIGNVTDGVTRVEACIAGEKATEGGAQVTFTQQTWEHIYKVKDTKFAESSIVGWYHSHPGFGIFLSDYDLFIHENFFAASHQVAWVFDPHSDEEGCFGWASGEIAPIERISVLRQTGDSYGEVGETSRPPSSLDGAVIAVNWRRLTLSSLNKRAPYVLIAITILCVAWGLIRSKTAHKVPASSNRASTPNNRPLTKLVDGKKAIITQQLSSSAVKRFFAQHNQVIKNIDSEVKGVQPATSKGKDAPGSADDNIEYVNYLIRYTWRGPSGDQGWTETTYTYDEVIHRVILIKCSEYHVSKGSKQPAYNKVACSLTGSVSDLLFEEN